MIKKLTSTGNIDETYKACSTLSNLTDVMYDIRNPSLVYALTEDSNELMLF